MNPRLWVLTLAGLVSTAVGVAHATGATGEDPLWRLEHGQPLERPGDPRAIAPRTSVSTRVANTITFGRFTSVQVNANLGVDIVGDAANEPSLAVQPANHDRMVIGWRQFETTASNFREAGFASTSDGGLTWETGTIQPGVFRSDPVLAVDDVGTFFYNSLTSSSGGIRTQLFGSFDSVDGLTWSPPVSAYGGDKQWMTMDRDLNHFYQAWSTVSNSYAPNTFDRSVDDGDSFEPPSLVPSSPIWGTLAVAKDHTVYLAGWNPAGGNFNVSRSDDAQNPLQDPPSFTTYPVDLGGPLQTGGPNPAGLLGQAWIAVDRSNGPRSGWVYLLASVATPNDPLDVHFSRSTDGGRTWSAPVRVNDDSVGDRAFQWFGTMSVSPSGRIDAVWNDTRGSTDSTQSALYYSWSNDGGTTWSRNEQATPTWDSTVGWPNQSKIGDYDDMTSDDDGADVAYAATFAGGQDVYYLRIPRVGSLAVGEAPVVPTRLLGSVPNPFAGATTLRFDAPLEGSRVRLEVFDVRGRRVATLVDGFLKGPGHSIRWDGREDDGSRTPPGIYLGRLRTSGHVETRKLLRIP